MNPYEQLQIADNLMPRVYEEGDYIVKQGEEGVEFFFLEFGEAKAYITTKGGSLPIYSYIKSLS